MGIGTNNPGNPLHLYSDTYPQLNIDGTDNSGNIGLVLSGSGGRGGLRWNGSNNDVELLREGGGVALSLKDAAGVLISANVAGDYGCFINNSNSGGYGLRIAGGASSADYLIRGQNEGGTDKFVVKSDGSAECVGNFTSTGGVVDGDSGLKTQQGEFKRLSSQSFSNGNLHDLTQVHQRPFIVKVEDSAGGLSTMGFPIGGSGIAYNWSMFDSDSNTWFSNGATITSTGTNGNTYQFSFNTGSGVMRIQRTAGSLSFTVRVYQIAE